jgi:hypothetical protein
MNAAEKKLAAEHTNLAVGVRSMDTKGSGLKLGHLAKTFGTDPGSDAQGS